jgi:NAD(P)-dependent dehydrogenase (short-subunit alcohol dehydrogenase family)
MVTEAFVSHLERGHNPKVIMISSRYGSIEAMSGPGDIAYRTSKAALNCAMHNIALTLESKHIIAISFHPGWVQTDMGGKNATLTAPTSVTSMRHVIESLTLKDAGHFYNYDGTSLPW